MADGKVTIQIDGDNQGLKRALEEVKSKLEGLNEPLNGTGDTAEGAMKKAVGGVDALAGALAAAGLAATLKEITAQLYGAYQAAQQFNSGMAQTYTLLPGISDELKTETTAAVIDLKNEFGIMADVATTSLYNTVSATGDLEQSLVDLEIGQKAAIGGATNLTTAMDGLTSVTNAYGTENINTQKASDLMFTAVRLGKTTFEELSSSLYNVLPITGANKIAFEDVTAALAHMTTQGVPTAQATTQLRQMFVELTDSSTDVAEIFEEIAGKSFKEFIAEGGNTQEALVLLDKYAINAGLGVSELFGSVEAGGAALALSGKNAIGYADKLLQMEKSVGSTEQAFDVMAQTSEYSANRFKSSVETMQISIGNVLEPSLKDLQDTGADAFIWAADFIDKNPWLVSSITATTAGLAVATTGVVGITAATTVATPVITAFNAAVSANPVGLMVVGITAATVALGTLIATMGDANPELEKATDFSKQTASAMQELTETAETNSKSADTQAITATKLIDRLEELETQGLKTAESQQEYSTIVDKLSELYPELNLAIDKNTGLLKGNATALKNEVEFLKEQSKASIYYDAQTAAISKLAEAEYELEINSTRYLELLEERTTAQNRLVEIEEILADTTGMSSEKVMALNGEYMQLQDMLVATTNEYMNETGVVEAYQSAVDSANLAVESATTQYETHNEAIAQTAQANAQATASYDAINEKLLAHKESINNLKESYDIAKQAALDNINSVVGGFAYMEETTATSVDNVGKTLQSQIDYMNTYSDNFATVMEKAGGAMPEEFVAQLSDGSIESAEILAGLATANEDEMTDIIEKMKSVSEGKEAFSTEIATIRTNFDVEMKKIQEEMDKTVENFNQTSEATSNTNATIDAVIQTVKSRTVEVENAYNALAAAADRSYRMRMKVNSPSKVFIQHTQSTIEGIEVGIKKDTPKVEQSYSNLAKSAISGYDIGMNALKTFANSDLLFSNSISSGTQAQTVTNTTSNSSRAITNSPALNFYGDVNDPDVVAQKVKDIFTYDLAGER